MGQGADRAVATCATDHYAATGSYTLPVFACLPSFKRWAFILLLVPCVPAHSRLGVSVRVLSCCDCMTSCPTRVKAPALMRAQQLPGTIPASTQHGAALSCIHPPCFA